VKARRDHLATPRSDAHRMPHDRRPARISRGGSGADRGLVRKGGCCASAFGPRTCTCDTRAIRVQQYAGTDPNITYNTY